jgi:L-alanine-DL-glutamate epimerase-like enolase superfamily enzyme
MKIKDIEIYYFDIPLQQPFKISIGTMHGANNVLVRILTDSGPAGLGEACPFPPITGETQETNLSIARNLRGLLIGKDPFAVGSFIKEAGSFLRTNPSIVAAFDMALYDIIGKAVSLPLYRLLGGAGGKALETDITADLDTPDNMALRAKEFAASGYRKIKVKVGQAPEFDLARLEAIREAVGYDCKISIDANQGWSVPEAISALKRLERFEIEFVEQPVAAWDLPGMREVRQHSPIPVMADEALFSAQDAIRLVKAEACDYFNIKLMKCGGVENALKIAHIAEAANIRAMVGCMLETRLALTAAAHVLAAQDNIVFADLDGNASHSLDPIAGGMTVSGGAITLSDEPGLGLDIEPDFLKKLRRA